jgi:prophage antirepressor-like protein
MYQGRELSLDNMISVSASEHSIPNKIANWVKDVVRETVRANLSLTYNMLGKKIYTHKDKYEPKVKALEWEMENLHTGLTEKFHSLEEENQQRQTAMDTYCCGAGLSQILTT